MFLSLTIVVAGAAILLRRHFSEYPEGRVELACHEIKSGVNIGENIGFLSQWQTRADASFRVHLMALAFSAFVQNPDAFLPILAHGTDHEKEFVLAVVREGLSYYLDWFGGIDGVTRARVEDLSRSFDERARGISGIPASLGNEFRRSVVEELKTIDASNGESPMGRKSH